MQMSRVIYEARQGCLPERNASREGHTSYIAVFSHTNLLETLEETIESYFTQNKWEMWLAG